MARDSGRRGSRPADRSDDEQVFSITGARPSITEDVGGRQRRYLISMGIRTICFVLAVVFSGWLRWAFILGAVVLPYVSVVIANAGRETVPDLPSTILLDRRPMIEAPPPKPHDGHDSAA